MKISVENWKMASAKSLEDMLSSEVDESAVSAIVGSLESQLSSPNIHIPSQDISSSTASANHIGGPSVSEGGLQQRLHDAQKHASVVVVGGGGVVNLNQPQGNVAVSNSANAKSLTSNSQIVGINSVVSAASSGSNQVMVTIAGALPASGYINQVTGTAQQALLSTGLAVSRPGLNNADIKIVYSPQPTTAQFNSSLNSNSVIQTQRKIAVPNGSVANISNLNIARPAGQQPGGNQGLGLTTIVTPVNTGASATTTAGMAAMQNLANVAAQQQPIIISSPSPATAGSPNYTIQAQLNSKQQQQLVGQRLTVREQLEQTKQTDRMTCKALGISKDNNGPSLRPENSGTPPGGTLMAVHSHPSSHQSPTLIQATANTSPAVITVSKSSQGQPVNVVTQMVSNPGLIPGMQIVNMTPGRGGGPNMNVQKTLAPRMVISGNPVRLTTSPQVLAAGGRHSAPLSGQVRLLSQVPNTITLQSGMVRGALLFKTENGQFQVLNVAQGITPTTQSGAMPSGATYRLQSVPGHQGAIRTLAPQQIVTTLPVSSAAGVKTSQIHTVHTTAGGQHMVGTVLQHGQGGLNLVTTVGSHHSNNSVVSTSTIMQHQHQNISQQGMAVKLAGTISANTSNVTQPLSIQTTTANSQSATTPSQMSPNTAKKKCKNFLSTLIRLATDQPEQVATNVKNLIQGLIDGAIQPEDFTNQLQKELNSSPQPCLVPFLKKSLPYLRHSLMTKELTIDGVRPPAPGAVTLPSTNSAIPQIQITQARPLAPPAPNTSHVRVMGPLPTGSALTAQLSQPAGAPGMVAQQRLLTVRSGTRMGMPNCGVTQQSKFAENFCQKVQNQRHTLKDHQNAQFRPRLTMGASQTKSLLVTSLAGSKTNIINATSTMASTISPVIQTATTASVGAVAASTSMSTLHASHSPAISSPAMVGVLQSKSKSSSGSSCGSAKEREKRNFASLSSGRDDDDINDVAAMGGVNLIEESQRILAANAEIVGTQIRSCKDENFFPTSPLQQRINSIISRHGMDEASSEVISIISHATQERLKSLVEKLGLIAEHRLENIKNDPRFEVTQDVKGQLKFLEELDRLEKKRHGEQEREILLRAAKSRSKLEDPEQLKLKQKAKEMQRVELEEMRQREANATALLAIGTRKRQKIEPGMTGSNQPGSSPGSSAGNSSNKPQMIRPRVKRVNLRDLLFLMEQERETVRTPFLYKSYFK